jgi:hypothetical protein
MKVNGNVILRADANNVTVNKLLNSTSGVNGVFYLTNSGGSITGLNGNAVIYNADSVNGGVHAIKVNGNEILNVNSNNVTAYKTIKANSGITFSDNTTLSSANFHSTAWLSYRYVILGNVVSSNNSNQSLIVYNSSSPTFDWYKLDIENVGGGGGGGSGHGYYIPSTASLFGTFTVYYYNNVYAGTGGGGGAAGGYATCTIYKNDLISAFNAIYSTGSSGNNLGTSTLTVTAYTGCGGGGRVCANNSNGTNGYSGGCSYLQIDMVNGVNTKSWQFAFAGGGEGGYLGSYLSSQTSSKTGLCYTPQESNTGISTATVGKDGLLGL